MRAPTGPLAATAATMISPPRQGAHLPPPPPPVYYDLEEPIHRRPVWPWIAALLFVLGAGIGGWFLYTQISNKLDSTKPVAVNEYRNMNEQLARAKIKADGFVPVVNHHASRTTAAGLVFMQSTPAGKRLPKQSEITIWVSTGLPKAVVPDLVHSSSTDAVATLTKLGLKPRLRQVPSAEAAGTVLAQDPPADTKATVGSTVWINVSKGPQPVAVPSVVGEPIDQASSELQAGGFNVSPRFVDDNQPKNTVIGQSPIGGTSAAKGSTVSLTISNGPKTSTVPDVTSTDVGSAEQTLQASGFKYKVAYQDVTDPSQVDVVLGQDPQGGTQQPAKTVVTLTVGRLAGTGTTTDTTTIPTP
jgi:serine/threonine-protein kinase